jgi:hypothetical protein
MTETSIFKQRVEEFHRRNGAVCFSDGIKFYYENGAYRDVHLLGVLAEPRDPHTREGEYHNAEIAVMFFKCKLLTAAKKFDEFDLHLSHILPPQRHERARLISELKGLRDAVEVCKKELAEAEQKLASTEIARRRASIRQANEERRQNLLEFHAQLEQVKIRI